MPEDSLADLRSVDPLFERSVDPQQLASCRDDFVGELVASEPVGSTLPTSGSRRHRRVIRLAIGFSAVAMVAVAFVLSGRGGSPEEHSAYAAQLIEFAESTPLVLLDSPGFTVRYVQSDGKYGGSMNFDRDEEGQPPISAELVWSTRPSFEFWIRDRANSTTRLSSDASVLGTEAHVFEYGVSKGRHEITALWKFDGQTLEMRSSVPDEATFMDMLASLKQVDADTWLDAMPESVIKSADNTNEVRKMLEGVPLPPGFEISDIDIPGLAQDRYQFGSVVTGTVACAWFAYWADARRNGDSVAEQDAVRAMATSPNWPILKQMNESGGYPAVIWGYAAQMPSGKWVGRPLEGDVNDGLGCHSRGVTLKDPEGNPLGSDSS